MNDELKGRGFIVSYTLIWLTFIMDGVVILSMVLHGRPDTDVFALISSVLAVWHLALAAAYGYEIGSSHSSQVKDDTIQKLVK